MKKFARRLLNKAGYDIVHRQYANSDIAEHLNNVIGYYNIDCVLDVGANIGQYARMLRRIGYRGHIVSFEPVRSVFEDLAKAAAADAKWHVHPVALGALSEQKSINVFRETVFSSFREPSEYSKHVWEALRNVNSEDVSVVRLDELFDRIKAATGAERFLLKLDTQGFDIEAFRGAASSLRHIPALQSELSLLPVYDQVMPPYEILNEFHAAGYAISGMYPINREPGLAVIEYDCVLVRRG